MKKGKITTIATGLALSTSMLFAGCLGGEATITGHYFDGKEENYLVYDNFSYENLKLKLKMSDGTTKEITITEDMIEELPDLSTKGEKVLKIKYEGRIYEMNFTVGGQTKEEMKAKIEAFYNDYKTRQKVGDVAMNVHANITAKWFGDTTSLDADATPEDFVITENDTKFDSLINALYSNSIDALVKASSQIALEDIIDSNSNTSLLNLPAALNNLIEGVSSIDYIRYFVDTVVLPGSTATHVENTTEYLMSGLCLDEDARTEVEALVALNINYIKHFDTLENKPTWEGNVYVNYIKDFVRQLNDIVQEYSTSAPIKTTINSINTSLQESNANAVSDLFKDLSECEVSLIYHYVTEEHGDGMSATHTEGVETEEAIEFTQKAFAYYGEFAKAFEDFIKLENFETTELAKEAISTLITTLNTTNDKFLALQTTLDEHEDWIVYQPYYMYDFHAMLEQTLACYDEESYTETVINLIQNFQVVEMALDFITATATTLPEFPLENIKTLIKDAVISLMRGETVDTVEYENYISLLCDAINNGELIETEYLEGTYDKDTYLEDYRTNGYATILSDFLQNEVLNFPPDNPEENHGYQAALECKKILLLIDQIPLNKSIDVETLLTHTNVVFSELYQMLQENKAEQEQEEENNDSSVGNLETWQPAILDHIADIVAMLTNPDYADKTAPDYDEDTFEFNLLDCLKTNVHKVENKYKAEIAELLAYRTSELMKVSTTTWSEDLEEYITTSVSGFEVGTEGFAELKNVFLTAINSHLNDTFKIDNVAGDFIEVVNTYAHDIIKPYINVGTILGLVMSGEEIDYNKVLESIELPPAIESVDYNQLISKVLTAETWTEAFDLSQVEVNFETDAQGNIVKEVMTVKLSCDLDLQLMGVEGDFTYRFEIIF